MWLICSSFIIPTYSARVLFLCLIRDLRLKKYNSTHIIDDRPCNDRRYGRDDDDRDGDAVQRVLRPTNLKIRKVMVGYGRVR